MGWLKEFFLGQSRNVGISTDAAGFARSELDRRINEHAELDEDNRHYNVRHIYDLSAAHSELATDVITALRDIGMTDPSLEVRADAVLFVDSVSCIRPEHLPLAFESLEKMFDKGSTHSQWLMAEMVGRRAAEHRDVAASGIQTLARMARQSADEFTRVKAINWIGAIAGEHYKKFFAYIVDPALQAIAPFRLDHSEGVRKTADDWTERLNDLKDRKIIPAP